MSVNITGKYPKIQRLITNFYSLDIALSNPKENVMGIPLTIYEIYGWPGCGKSTFVQCISGIIGRELKKDISIAPIEEIDVLLLKRILDAQQFNGECHLCLQETDEKTIDELIENIHTDNFGIAVLDSVGAISPISEMEADSIAEVNMGKRAILTAKLARGVSHAKRFKEIPLTFFFIGHLAAIIGGRGSQTNGAAAIKYLSKVRIRLTKKEEFDKDGSYVISGVIEKHSYGPENRKFNCFCLAGQGIHLGLSAILDCETLKKSTRTNGVVKMDGVSYGRITKLIEEAHAGNNEVFQPFIDALKGSVDTVSDEEETQEEADE